MQNLPYLILPGLLLGLYLILMIRFLVLRFGPVKTVRAVVVHKQTVDTRSYRKAGSHLMRYAVTFQIGQKRKSFYVSELSYHGYRKGEQGMLTYRGDRLMDFQ